MDNQSTITTMTMLSLDSQKSEDDLFSDFQERAALSADLDEQCQSQGHSQSDAVERSKMNAGLKHVATPADKMDSPAGASGLVRVKAEPENEEDDTPSMLTAEWEKLNEGEEEEVVEVDEKRNDCDDKKKETISPVQINETMSSQG